MWAASIKFSNALCKPSTIMVKSIKKYLLNLKLLFAVCLIPVAAVCKADGEANYARVFEAVCIASRLEPRRINALLEMQQRHEFIEATELALSSPDADAGALFLNNGKIYFLVYGARSDIHGGAFCSLGTEGFAHSDLKLLMKNYFTTFSFMADERIGGSNISVYEAFLPGFPKDMAVSIQSDYGISVVSLYSTE